MFIKENRYFPDLRSYHKTIKSLCLGAPVNIRLSHPLSISYSYVLSSLQHRSSSQKIPICEQISFPNAIFSSFHLCLLFSPSLLVILTHLSPLFAISIATKRRRCKLPCSRKSGLKGSLIDSKETQTR